MVESRKNQFRSHVPLIRIHRLACRALVVALASSLALSGVPARAWADSATPVPVDVASKQVPAAPDQRGEVLEAESEGPAIAGPTSTGTLSEGAAAPESTSADAAGSAQEAAAPDGGADESGVSDAAPSAGESEGTGISEGAQAQAAARVTARVSIIGPDASGEASLWAPASDLELEAGSTAADATVEAFQKAGLAADYGEAAWGWSLSSITSPVTGKALGYDAASGSYWQLFVNGGLSSVGAGSYAIKEGDEVAWVYGADGVLPGLEAVTARVIGVDANGNAEDWAASRPMQVVAGTTAAQLSEALFKDAGLTAVYGNGSWGWYLTSIDSPFTGDVLGYDQATGRYWQLFVNGSSSSVGAGSVVLKAGDSVTWYYAADASKLPGDDAPVIDPTAPRPSDAPSWSGFGNGGSSTVTDVVTPSDSADALWTTDLKAEGEFFTSVGDPIIVGGFVYVTTTTDLMKIDRSTGSIVKRIKTGGSTTYFSRPAYADGVIVIPSDDGSVAAFTADTLTCVWRTAALKTPVIDGKESRYQALSTVTIMNGCAIVPFVAGAGASGAARAGALVCVRLSDGAVLWSDLTVKDGASSGEGYYWAGAAAAGDAFVIGDEGGRILLKDAATGETLSSVNVGMPVRSTVVKAGEEDGKQVFLAVGRAPATLFKVVRDGDELVLAGSCAFTAVSTSTPAVANGYAYVGGIDGESWTSHGVLSVIDLSTMTVRDQYKTEQSGEVKASPLVSVQGDDTYVYFTCNSNPGALYRYTESTREVAAIYTPDAAQQNYCTASAVVDTDGNLYYSNDSGTLFALKAAAGYRVTFDAGNGTSMPVVAIAAGKTVRRPADPVRAGYVFGGWFADEALTIPWDFDRPVTSALTLHAKWTPVSAPDPDPVPAPTPSPVPAGGMGTDRDLRGATIAQPFRRGSSVGGASSASPAAKAGAGASSVSTGGSDDMAAGSSDGSTAGSSKGVSSTASNAAAAKTVVSSASLPLALGMAGLAGLIAAGLWFAFSRRRGESR